MDSNPPSQDRDRPLTFGAAALWTLLALFLNRLLLGLAESGREGAIYDLVTRTGCLALAYSVVLFAILRIHEPETSIRHLLAVRAPSVLSVIFALGLGAALSLPSEWLDQLLDAKFPTAPDEQESLDKLLSIATLGKRITLVATLVFLVPVLDELFFRGVLFTALRRTRRAEIVVIATAAFETLGSLSPRTIVSLVVASVAFSWMRATTGTVVTSALARIAFFGVGVVPLLMGRETPKPTKVLVGATVAVGLVSLVGLVLLGRRDTRLAAARLEDGA